MEQTFVLIKPDAVKRRLVGEIISRYERKGLTIEAMRLDYLTTDIAEVHYSEHATKPFFGDLVKHVTSGPAVLMVLSGPDAVQAVRKINGATNPVVAEPGSIRGDFGLEITANLVHGSDSLETAKREIKLFFPDLAS